MQILLEDNVQRDEIEPLPNNIPSIYEMALSVKKKAAKDNRKKEKKEARESGDYIPSAEDVENIMNGQGSL